MLSRIFAFFILLATIYIGIVFLFPSFADSIGNPLWNKKIRNIKTTLESESGALITEKPLIENITDIAQPYIDETRSKTEAIQTTITEKTEQVRQAADSVKQAVDAVDTAKESIKKATTFGTGS